MITYRHTTPEDYRSVLETIAVETDRVDPDDYSVAQTIAGAMSGQRHMFTMLDDGEPIAVFGALTISPCMLHAGVALITEEARRHPINLTRTVRRLMQDVPGKIQAWVDDKLDVSVDDERWLRALGFVDDGNGLYEFAASGIKKELH